jgi:aryl carrier-like protein
MTSATLQIIAAVWRDVLENDDVGIHDNFFDIGGSSLLMTRVHAKLSVALHRDVALVDLLRYPTIAALAATLESRAPGMSGENITRTTSFDDGA